MRSNFLKKLFYIPNYIALPVAGVEICNKSIKYIEFNNKKGSLTIKKYGEIALPPNVVKDGEILNKTALSKSLTEVKKQLSSDFLKVSIPEEKTYIFEIQIPREAKSDIREALEFKIEENVPLKLDEVFFEYEIINESKDSKDINVSVSVIPKRVISEYTEVFDLAGLYPLSFKIESRMIANSIIPRGDMRTFMVIDIKDDSTLLAAVVDGVVRFTSSVSIGETAIKESLVKIGAFSKENIDKDIFENVFSFENTYNEESYTALLNIFSIIKDEVEKFNEYVISKFSSKKNISSKTVEKIILCGRSSAIPGFAKHIGQNLNIEVILGNAWANVFDIKEHAPTMKFQDSLSFVTPIGLAIPPKNKTLNFLTLDNKNRITFEYLLRIAIYFLSFTFLSTIILIVLFFPSVFFSNYKNNSVKDQLESAIQNNLNKGEDPILLIKSANRMAVALSSDSSASSLTKSEIISKIISLKNKDIKITSIDIIEDNDLNKKIIMSGFSKTRDNLTLYKNDLKTDGTFSEVIFPVTDFIKSSNSDFQASLTYNKK